MPRSNWAREPQLLSLRVWSLCSATREAATVRGPRAAMKSGPRSLQLEKALAQKRRPNTAKKKKKRFHLRPRAGSVPKESCSAATRALVWRVRVSGSEPWKSPGAAPSAPSAPG